MEKKNIISTFEVNSRLKIRNENFSNESDFDHSVKWLALARIIFVDWNFEDREFMGECFWVL